MKAKKRKDIASKFPLVGIAWCDAISNEGGWQSLKEARKWGKNDNWVVHEVGWVIKETKKYILLASKLSKGESGREDQYGGVIKIPTTWILERTELKNK